MGTKTHLANGNFHMESPFSDKLFKFYSVSRSRIGNERGDGNGYFAKLSRESESGILVHVSQHLGNGID